MTLSELADALRSREGVTSVDLDSARLFVDVQSSAVWDDFLEPFTRLMEFDTVWLPSHLRIVVTRH
jgi:hypothetical protein